MARAELGDGWDLCPRFNYVIGHGLRVWFAGPASAFRYLRCVADVPGASRRRAFGSALRLFNHAVCWLCGPVCAVGCLIAGLFTAMPWVSAAVAIGVRLYTGLPNSAAARLAIDRAGGMLTARARVETVLGGPFAYFLYGAAACWSATLLVAEALFAIRPSKPRTPMRAHGGDEARVHADD